MIGETRQGTVSGSASNAGHAEVAELLVRLKCVDFPTLGHFLDEGFCQGIQQMVPGRRMLGIATTAWVPDADAVSVNRALLRLNAGEVLVLQMADGETCAPVGAVTAASAVARGAAGIVVDGPVTDLDALNGRGDSSLPVYARGSTCLTTKRHASGAARFGEPVLVGGVTIRPGDIVLGDRNGVVVVAPHVARGIVEHAADSDAAEPEILRRIAEGEPLEDILYLG